MYSFDYSFDTSKEFDSLYQQLLQLARSCLRSSLRRRQPRLSLSLGAMRVSPAFDIVRELSWSTSLARARELYAAEDSARQQDRGGAGHREFAEGVTPLHAVLITDELRKKEHGEVMAEFAEMRSEMRSEMRASLKRPRSDFREGGRESGRAKRATPDDDAEGGDARPSILPVGKRVSLVFGAKPPGNAKWERWVFGHHLVGCVQAFGASGRGQHYSVGFKSFIC